MKSNFIRLEGKNKNCGQGCSIRIKAAYSYKNRHQITVALSLTLLLDTKYVKYSVSQPMGRGQISMGLKSSHFAKFYYKTV